MELRGQAFQRATSAIEDYFPTIMLPQYQPGDSLGSLLNVLPPNSDHHHPDPSSRQFLLSNPADESGFWRPVVPYSKKLPWDGQGEPPANFGGYLLRIAVDRHAGREGAVCPQLEGVIGDGGEDAQFDRWGVVEPWEEKRGKWVFYWLILLFYCSCCLSRPLLLIVF